MNFRIENLWMLLGLFALAVPILLHLLQRRRFDTLDWGAMQFLPDSIAAQRKRWLDEILLMLLRMAMIALIVIALATPVSTSAWLAPLGDRSSREIVIVLDGSFSMDVRVPSQESPWTEALRSVGEQIDQASSNDSFTFIIARQPPVVVRQFDAIPGAPPPANPDMPRALSEAWNHLKRSNAASKEIIVLTDGQKHGWADLATLAAFDNLGNQWRADAQIAKEEGTAIPSLRVVNVGDIAFPQLLPNFRLDPLIASRGVVKIGQKATFRSALHLDGLMKNDRPGGVTLEIDGEKIHEFSLPLRAGSHMPLSFQHRFAKEGRHMVAMTIKPDPANDALAADNRQQFNGVVKEWPILLVDGEERLSDESSSLFLTRALLPEITIPHTALKASEIVPELSGEPKPAVIVLADVPHLDAAQVEAIDRFLAQGGGLLILAGERMVRGQAFYNGLDWLPAKLSEVASSQVAVKPDPRKFQHAALESLRAWPDASMREVSFKKWWKTTIDPTDRTTVIGRLTNGDPFLLEKPYKQGRVILCTVPPDRRWDSTLPKVGEFLILMYELTYYLAGNRELTARANVEPALDPHESELTRCTDEDWRKVRNRLPIKWHEQPASTVADDSGGAQREELWWLLLLAVVGLLCSEVWMTRRMALARGR